MSALTEVIASRLGQLPAYRPGLPSGSTTGKLSSNEAALGAPPSVFRALAQGAAAVSRYPDEEQFAGELAASLGVERDRLVLTNGSDELCSLVATVFLAPGDRAVLGSPAYAIDATVSRLSGAEVVRVPLTGGRHDVVALARAAAEASVLWLPNPHNPTGTVVAADEVAWLLRHVPPTCVVVLDEAYRGYADPAVLPDVGALSRAHENLLVQRTLSKDWALAGLRLGYGLGAPEVVCALRRVRAPFSVGALSLTAGRAALRDPGWRTMAVERVRHERSLLEATLRELDVEFFPSETNFVLVRLPHARLAPFLAEAGISVRPGEDLDMPGWVRITVGWAPIMTVLRGVLRRAVADLRAGVPGEYPTEPARSAS